jgi:pimeloyl-ACP methyl ester carboxylesterase
MKPDSFHVAGDLSTKTAAVLAAEQRPHALAAGAEPTEATAWKTIPSWALVGTADNAITPAQQLFMALRAGATIEEVDSSHLSMISHPEQVTQIIETAAEATG